MQDFVLLKFLISDWQPRIIFIQDHTCTQLRYFITIELIYVCFFRGLFHGHFVFEPMEGLHAHCTCIIKARSYQ